MLQEMQEEATSRGAASNSESGSEGKEGASGSDLDELVYKMERASVSRSKMFSWLPRHPLRDRRLAPTAPPWEDGRWEHHHYPEPYSWKELCAPGQVFPVLENRMQNPAVRSWAPVDFQLLKDLKSAVDAYGVHAPFTFYSGAAR